MELKRRLYYCPRKINQMKFPNVREIWNLIYSYRCEFPGKEKKTNKFWLNKLTRTMYK